MPATLSAADGSPLAVGLWNVVVRWVGGGRAWEQRVCSFRTLAPGGEKTLSKKALRSYYRITVVSDDHVAREASEARVRAYD